MKAAQRDRQEVINIQGLVNYYDELMVHEGLDLQINQGEVVAIIGNSGSGKTTLLRSILMLHRPQAGAIQVLGCDVVHCSPAKAQQVRQQWGVMFQSGALYSSLTVLENVMFPLNEFTRLDNKTLEKIARFRLLLAGLGQDAVTKYPADISGGMRKRAAMARAMAMDPQLLFLDEPTAGLDPQSAESIDNLVLHLNKQLGLTVVMVTHDLDTLWQATDRVVFLGEGKVLADGPIDEVVASHYTAVKRYFGGHRAQSRIQQ